MCQSATASICRSDTSRCSEAVGLCHSSLWLLKERVQKPLGKFLEIHQGRLTRDLSAGLARPPRTSCALSTLSVPAAAAQGAGLRRPLLRLLRPPTPRARRPRRVD